jgi:hypothetical protein
MPAEPAMSSCRSPRRRRRARSSRPIRTSSTQEAWRRALTTHVSAAAVAQRPDPPPTNGSSAQRLPERTKRH